MDSYMEGIASLIDSCMRLKKKRKEYLEIDKGGACRGRITNAFRKVCNYPIMFWQISPVFAFYFSIEEENINPKRQKLILATKLLTMAFVEGPQVNDLNLKTWNHTA